ncbi:unnamed protein product [Protopolystoma xenopodis]|uniref:Uncharacterized protein n=1 Tax=Protopolystoma xenopodis TaxID=117903 RepID=A0A3S5AJN6_9PLAT|nr:unnamed protein product [Protopolystoma xenopodis]
MCPVCSCAFVGCLEPLPSQTGQKHDLTSLLIGCQAQLAGLPSSCAGSTDAIRTVYQTASERCACAQPKWTSMARSCRHLRTRPVRILQSRGTVVEPISKLKRQQEPSRFTFSAQSLFRHDSFQLYSSRSGLI